MKKENSKTGGIKGSSIKTGLSEQKKIPRDDKSQDTQGKSQMPPPNPMVR